MSSSSLKFNQCSEILSQNSACNIQHRLQHLNRLQPSISAGSLIFHRFYIRCWFWKEERAEFIREVNPTTNDRLYDPKRTSHLLALEGPKERLHLFRADLLENGSFDAAIDGCECVFHTVANPQLENLSLVVRLKMCGSCRRVHVFFEAEFLDTAPKGTLNVLESCAKSSSAKRVVLTSFVADVPYNGKPRTVDVVVDETWWFNPDTCLTGTNVVNVVDWAKSSGANQFLLISNDGIYRTTEEPPYVEGVSFKEGQFRSQDPVSSFRTFHTSRTCHPFDHWMLRNQMQQMEIYSNCVGDRTVTLDRMAKLCAQAAGLPVEIVNYDPKAVGVEGKKAFPFRVVLRIYAIPLMFDTVKSRIG